MKKMLLVAAVCLACSGKLQAQISPVGTTHAASNDGSKQWSVTVTPAAGDALLVGCDFNAGISFVGVSDSAADTFVLLGPEADDNSLAARAYLAPNVKGGSTTVTCTAASSAGNNEIYVTELSGVNAAAPVDKFLSVAGSSSPATGSLTTANANEFVWAYAVSGTVTNATGWTSLSSFHSNLVTSLTQATPAKVSPSFRATRGWTLIAVALNPAGSSSAPPPAVISVSVSPTSAGVQVGQSSAFSASLQNDTQSKGVTWSLSGAGCSGATCGTLTGVTTNSVTYNAPATAPNPATVTLTATSVADTTKSASATITVTTPPPPISVTVNPSSASVQVSTTAPFAASLQNDTQSKGVTWSLSGTGCSGATCGTLTSVTTISVTYNAPATAPNPATVTLTATSVADSSKSASATITVTTPPPPISVGVNPASASVQISTTAPFTATLQNDTQSKGVAWSLSGTGCSGATCGTLTGATTTSVAYNAPATAPNPPTVTLTATSVADTTKSASATITVTTPPPPISVNVSPSSTSVQVSTIAPFTATLQNDTQGKGVTWSLSGTGCSGATCGTLTSVTTTSVTYNAPATTPSPATVTLTATSVADTTKSALAPITVTSAPPPISVGVNPASASVQISTAAPFTASLQNDTQGKGVTWSLSGTGCSGAACGTLTSATTTSVAYNAPATAPNPATVTLTATSVADTTKSASATITVTTPPPPISVNVSPSSTSVQVSTSASFTASLQNDAQSKGVTWSLSGTGCSGAACGALTNVTTTSVTYNAPAIAPTPATVTLTATSVADTTKSASSTLAITTPTGQPALITVVGTTHAASKDGSRTWSVSLTPVAGDTLVAGCDFNVGLNFTGVTDSVGDTFTLIAPEADSPSFASRAYIASNVKGGATTVTCTAAAAASFDEIYVTELSGVSPTAPLDKALSVAGPGSPATGSLTVLNPNEFLWAYLISGSVTNASGWTALSTFDDNLVTSLALNAPANVQPAFTTSRDWTMILVALVPAGAGSSPPPISISIAPANPSVQVSSSTPFTATLQNDTQNKGVTWALSGGGCSGATCGTLTGVATTSATYNAPATVPAPATVTLTATSVADTTKSASTAITVTAAPPPISVSINPVSASIQISTMAPFTASLQNDTLSKGVTWALSGVGCSGAACGTLTSVATTSVTYNAPATVPSPAAATLTATSIVDTTKSASAAITITIPSTTVTLSLHVGSVTLSQSQQFTATVTGDPQNLGVTYSVDGNPGGNATTGTISASGLFTPGTQPGLHTITAVGVANPSASDSTTNFSVTDVAGVFTHHYDAQRTGQNLKEYALSPSTVSSTTFGALFSCSVNEGGSVPGYTYAQPLYVANLTMPDGKAHNVVYVATESDFVYAFDADANPCQLLWKASMLDAAHGAAAGATTVPAADTGETGDLVPEIGITSTPVIDPSTNTLYVCSKTKEPGPVYVHRLHALDLTTGAEKFGGPVAISAASFDPLMHMQRPALLLNNGTVYLAFGSHGDKNTWHGWVMAYNAATLAQTFVWASTDLSANTEGSVWGAGAGPAADASGNVWVETGNGNFDGTINYSDSVVKLSSSGSVADFFTPSYQDTLRANDIDLGSGAVVILPDSVGSTAHPHLAVATGKPGGFFLLDQSNLGKFNSSVNNDVQEVFPQGLNTSMVGGGVFGVTAYWNGNLYISVIRDNLRQYPIANGVIAATSSSNSSHSFSFPGAVLVISANGTTGGIVWATEIGGYSPGSPVVLYAFDATNLGSQLYVSPSSGTGAAGNAVKFTVPTVANGKAYIAGQGQLTVFGLLPK